jgi:hypothetical protein
MENVVDFPLYPDCEYEAVSCTVVVAVAAAMVVKNTKQWQ